MLMHTVAPGRLRNGLDPLHKQGADLRVAQRGTSARPRSPLPRLAPRLPGQLQLHGHDGVVMLHGANDHLTSNPGAPHSREPHPRHSHKVDTTGRATGAHPSAVRRVGDSVEGAGQTQLQVAQELVQVPTVEVFRLCSGRADRGRLMCAESPVGVY